MKVAINGFGRIGRTITRILWERGRHEVVHVNDLNGDAQNLAYLLRNDSSYGRFPGIASVCDDRIRLSDEKHAWDVALSSVPQTTKVDWASSAPSVVIEATGTDDNHASCRQYLGDTIRWAVITHTSAHADATIVDGVNAKSFDPSSVRVISTSICDANAMAPIVHVIASHFGIDHAFLTTLHPWLAYQNLVDGPVRSRAQPGSYFPDFALGRASVGSVIPKSTTAGSAVESIVAGVRGKLTSLSYRVPTASVCYGTFAAALERDTSSAEVLSLLRGELSHVVRFTDEPLVSTDLIGESSSAVVDERWVSIANKHFLQLSAGYDNEWGYCCRVADMLDRLEEALNR